MIDLLMTGLRRTAPGHLKVRREMTVVLDRRNGPEPDISVIRAGAVTGPEQTSFEAADVLLAVEVVSPDSEARDRDTKPRKYAAAGIEHFWLVEMTGESRHPVVRVYELDPVTKAYALTGIHHDQLKLGVPYDIGIDITLDALKELWPGLGRRLASPAVRRDALWSPKAVRPPAPGTRCGFRPGPRSRSGGGPAGRRPRPPSRRGTPAAARTPRCR